MNAHRILGLTVLFAIFGMALAQGPADAIMPQEARPAKVATQAEGALGEILDEFTDSVLRQQDAWFQDGEFTSVTQSMRFVHAIYPKDQGTISNLGWMLSNLGRHHEAWWLYRTTRMQDPKNPELAYHEAEFLFIRRAYADVAAILQAPYLTKQPAHPNLFRMLATSYRRLQMLQDALDVYDSYLKLVPSDAAAKRNRDAVAAEIQRRRAG